MEVASLTDDVEDVEVDVNHVDDRITTTDETVMNDNSGMFYHVAVNSRFSKCYIL